METKQDTDSPQYNAIPYRNIHHRRKKWILVNIITFAVFVLIVSSSVLYMTVTKQRYARKYDTAVQALKKKPPVVTTDSAKTSILTVRSSKPVGLDASPAIFRDSPSGVALSIQLNANQPDSGNFTLYIPQKGYYRGKIITSNNTAAEITLQATVTTEFSPENGGLAAQIPVEITGEIQNDMSAASVTFSIEGSQYTINTEQIDTSAIESMAAKIIEFTVSKNWTALYELTAAAIKQSTSREEFIKTMSVNTPAIVSGKPAGKGQLKTVTAYTYYLQPVTFTVKESNGTVREMHENEIFINEDGQWRFLTTDTRK